MTDNKIRCALVYRLASGMSNSPGRRSDPENGTAPVLLAKYDHAAQYETHGGAKSGALYGGRDKSYADACAMVISNDPPRFNPKQSTSDFGGFKVVNSDVHQVVYGVDQDGTCCAVITGLKYPSRVAIQMLTDLHKQFAGKFGVQQMKSATVNSLSKKAKPILSSVCKKYDDLSKVDKAQSIISQVDEVKNQMQGNIASMLANTEKAEGIKEQSELLTEQANVFKKQSKELKRTMWWKDAKTTALLAGLVVVILVAVLVPLIMKFK